ncbi:zinc finger protein 252-like [Anneissia japonica]|uniref:zinc finger protein 252-like n=1 Tax=Anneissia japonica TaxID=1529436 RepID=UPI0014258C01|nr:zinc finger protein 252-like [Anneissia japonica]
MEEEIHVVDSGTIPAADSGSMVVVTDEHGKHQILHFTNNEQNSAEMLLEDLPAQLQEESMTVMQQETIDDIDYCAHQRAAEVLQSMGVGVAGQIEEENAASNQAVVYVEGGDHDNERQITSDAIAAALQQAGATGSGDEQSQVIVLEGGSDGMVDMADVGDDFQGTLIVIMQQDEQQGEVMDAADNLQVHEASAFMDPKEKQLAEQNVASFHSTEVFHELDENFKENIECKDVSHEPVLEKPHHCKHCDKKFAWKRSLIVHERIHTGKDMFSCDQCGKSYSSKVSLQSHIATHTKQEDKPFSCDICGKYFTKKWDWETHKWQHTGQKKYICEHCGKTYARNSDLRRHVLSHTGNKPFQCRFCGKRFITRWHYNYHERRHTGVKPYQCQLCWKEFMQKCHLDRHEITHASETYNCRYCGRKYMHKDELTRHERTHLKRSKETDVSPSDSTIVANVGSANDDVSGNVDAALEYLMAFAQGQVGENGNTEIQESPDQKTKEQLKCFGCKQYFADHEELQNHKKDQPDCCVAVTSSACSIHCKYCTRVFKYKTSFIKHVTSHAAFHFDDEYDDLKLEIDERSKQILSMQSSIFVCVHCCRAYSAEEKLSEHKEVCAGKLDKNEDQKENIVNDQSASDTLKIPQSAEKTDADYTNDAAADNDVLNSKLDAGELIGLSDTNGESQNTDNLDYNNTTNKSQQGQVKTILAYDEGRKVQIPISNLIYVCRFCDCEFKYKTSFERHEEHHEENNTNIENQTKSKRPFICTLCGVGFRRPFHLMRHMETHSKKTTYKPAKKLKTVQSPKINAGKDMKTCEEILEIRDLVRNENTLSLSDELDDDLAKIKNESLNENTQTEKEPENLNVTSKKTGKFNQNPKQMSTLDISLKKSSPNKNKMVYELPTTTTTRSRRSIRLPKRFRTSDDESTLDEEEEEVIKVEEKSEKAKQSITVASPKKRGRPKKLHKESYECGKCKKTFPFQSLLRYHNNAKHKKLEIGDKNKDVGDTALNNQTNSHDFNNSYFDMETSPNDLENENETICNGSPVDDNSALMINYNVKTRAQYKEKSIHDDQPVDCDEIKDLVIKTKEIRDEVSTESRNKEKGSSEIKTKGIRTRSKANDFLCDQCGRKFASQVHVLRHQQSHIQKNCKLINKSPNKKQYSCGQCDKVLKTRALLKRHELLHQDKKGFRCITCDKTFRRSDDLTRHNNSTHSGKKPYSCEICGKTFPYKFPLKTHMQSHTGARPYMCDVCGKMFAKKYDMEAHHNMHTGNTPHVCNICSKKYGRKADLDRHMTKHTGTQPLSCSLCDRKFSTRWHLKYHERTHTGEKPYTCDICNRKFAQLPHLNKHMMLHNKKKEASTNNATSIENDNDKEFDGNTLLKSVVRGLQQVNESAESLGVLQDDSQQIIQVLQVENNNPDELQVFNLILP